VVGNISENACDEQTPEDDHQSKHQCHFTGHQIQATAGETRRRETSCNPQTSTAQRLTQTRSASKKTSKSWRFTLWYSRCKTDAPAVASEARNCENPSPWLVQLEHTAQWRSISNPATNFFGLVRARTSSHKLSQAKKGQKSISSKGTYISSKAVLELFSLVFSRKFLC
jgi:hypothetical protein